MSPLRSSTTFHGRAVRIGLAVLGASGLLQCSPERTLLTTVSGSSVGGSSGTSVAGSFFGAAAGSVELGEVGGRAPVGGEPNVGGSGAAGAGLGGEAAAGGGMPVGGGSGSTGTAVTPCVAHSDCGAGSVCVSNTCKPCMGGATACPDVCPKGFTTQTVERNGCMVCECVPPSTCASNTDCPSDEVCYAGAQCQTGCSTPDCCFGNHCAAPGCGSTAGLNCGAVGCPLGGTCFSVCAAPSCTCTAGAWHCDGDGTAGSGNSCAWVCTSP